MSGKPTPGPWAINTEGGDSVYSTTDTTGADIVCLSPMSEGWLESAMHWPANAHLIAAAPDMLEALEALMAVQGIDNPSESECESIESIEAAEALATAAIKKARGQT